jgi:hypothetical protein
MRIARASSAGVIVAAVVVGTVAAGCSGGGDEESSSSSTSKSASASATSSSATSAEASPSAAASADYSGLLIKASDIDPSLKEAGAPILNPNGVSGVGQGFLNPAQNETIYDTIVVADDPDAAARGLEGLKNDLPKKVTGAPQPADVGTGGMIASGTSPDGSKAITEVLFTEGRAVVNLEFESPANDPVQPETAIAIAHMQDDAVKKGLPS